MKKITLKISFVLLCLLTGLYSTKASSIFVSDTLHTSAWIADTVYVQSDIHVTDTLIINPGVTVLFEGFYKITFANEAVLYSNGSSGFPIYFKPLPGNEATGWAGIEFMQGPYNTGSEIMYTHFYYAKTDGSRNYGGALYINEHYNLTINHCTFKNCAATENGGAIYTLYSPLKIQNCFFTQNTSNNGTAVGANVSDVTLLQNIIVNNDGNSQIDIYGEGNFFLMYNNTISHNQGSPMLLTGTNAEIKNNIIANHNAGIKIGNWLSNLTFTNNCMYNIPDIENTIAADSIYYNDNLKVEPAFVNQSWAMGSSIDGSTYDWHLLGSSPLINAGTKDTTGLNLGFWDIENSMRIYNTGYQRIDIGAYEFQGIPTSAQLVFNVAFNSDTLNTGLVSPLNGTPSHATTYVNSRFADQKALEFDGSQSVMFSPVTAMQGNNQFTLSAWIKPMADDSAVEYVIMSSTNFGNEWQFSLKDHKLILKLWSGGTLQKYETIYEKFYKGAWYLATVTVDGSSVNFYKNAENYESLSYIGGTIDDHNSNLTIGSFAGFSNFFVGSLNQVRIFDKAISYEYIESLAFEKSLHYKDRDLYKSVTFRVNLGYYIQNGTFNPETESVDIAGEFNGWGEIPTYMYDPYKSGVYEVTLNKQELEIGKFYEFKFRTNGNWDGLHDFSAGENRKLLITDELETYSACLSDSCLGSDMAILKLLNPESGCGMMSMQNVEVEYGNVGSDTLHGEIYLSYYTTSTGWVKDTVTMTDIPPMYVGIHTFTTPVETMMPGKYYITLALNKAGDTWSENDSIVTSFYNQPTKNIPYFDNFESTDDWMVDGQNPSWQRGYPSNFSVDAPVSGSNCWITGLNNNSASKEFSYLVSPCFYITAVDALGIRFKFAHNTSNFSGAHLEYFNSTDSIWMECNEYLTDEFNIPNESLNDLTGSYWKGRVNHWKTAVFKITNPPSEIKFRIFYVNNSTEPSRGFAIDDFEVFSWNNENLSIIETFPRSGPVLDQTPGIKLKNYGLQSFSGNVIWHGTYDLMSSSDTTYVDLSPMQESIIYSTTNQDFDAQSSINGAEYRLDPTIFTQFTDTLIVNINNLEDVSTYPWFEGFESNPENRWNIYSNQLNGDPVWKIDSPSGTQLNEAYEGGNALTTITNQPLPSNVYTFAESPRFDMTSLVKPTLSFYMKRHLADINNKIFLLVIDNENNYWHTPVVVNSINWMNPVYSLNYGQTNGYAEVVDMDWVYVTASMPELSGKTDVQFKFVLENGYNWDSDEGILIDNLIVNEASTIDMALVNLTNPVLKPNLGNESITVLLTNQGISDAASGSYSLSYSINGGASISESTVPFVGSGDTVSYTFTAPFNFSATGFYHIKLAVYKAGDTLSFNDSLEYHILNQPLISTFPYLDSFDGTIQWISPSESSLWTIGSPDGTHINNAYSGLKSLYTELNGVTEPVVGIIESPWFDFSTITNPAVSLQIWKDLANSLGGAALQATKDSCKTWETLGSYDINWYNDYSEYMNPDFENSYTWSGQSVGWINNYYSYNTLDLGGKNAIKFRLIFKSNQLSDTVDGFAFDNFTIYDATIDLSINQVDDPLVGPLGTNHTITFSVQNKGIELIQDFDLMISVDSGEWITENFVFDIYPLNTQYFTTTNTFDLSAEGMHQIQLAVAASGDVNPYNDSLTHLVEQNIIKGITEDFTVNQLENWTYDSNYYLENNGGELKITATDKTGWEAFYYITNPLSITENPFLSVRLKSDSAVIVRFCYVDSDGIWTDFSNNGFTLIPDGAYHTYFWDFTNKLKNYSQIPVNSEMIQNVAIQFNPGNNFTGIVYIDDLKLGSHAVLTENLKMVSIEAGDGCNSIPAQKISVKYTNLGLSPLSNIDLKLDIDLINLVNTMIPDTLLPGDTVIYETSAIADFSTSDYYHTFTINAILSHVNDQNSVDNSKTLSYKVFGNYTDQPGWKSYNFCDGMADNNVWGLEKDLDGNIWMTGFKGVSKFDGTNFIQYHVADGLASEYSWNIQTATDGTVWLPSTEGGFTSFKNGVFTKYYPFDSLLFEECSFEDLSGNLWFGSYAENGVAMFDGTNWHHYPTEAGTIIEDIDLAPNGNLLFANLGSVMQYNGSSFSSFLFDSVRSESYVNEIFRDSRNVTWFYGGSELTAYSGTTFTDYSIYIEPIGNIQAIEEDGSGKVWFGGSTGAASFNGTTWSYVSPANGLIPSDIWSMVGTPNGDMWFGTRLGASHYKVGPKALFEYAINSNEVIFNSLSEGSIESYLYTFDDGDSAFIANPVHVFIPGSSYEVCLKVTDFSGNSDTYCTDISIETILCEAHFNYTMNKEVVTFTDSSSTNITEYLWNFGDGNTSTLKDPVHVYQNTGTYNVLLSVTDSTGFCNNSINKEIVISEMSSAKMVLEVDMSYQINSGLFDPLFDFVDVTGNFNSFTGTPLADVNGDQIYEATINSLTIGDTIEFKFRYNGDWCQPHEFAFGGEYRKAEITKYVDTLLHIFNDQPYDPVYRSFNISMDMSRMVYTHEFNPETDELKVYGEFNCWNNYILEDPDSNFIYTFFADSLFAKQFDTLSIYFVINEILYETKGTRKTAFNAVDNSANFIWNDESDPIADFIYTTDSLTVTFNNHSYGNIISYLYSFGDGNISTLSNPVYTYQKGGNYEVCLTINDVSGATNTGCKQIIVGDSTLNNCYAMFTFEIFGDSVKFNDSSSANVTLYFWDFGDNNFDTQKNPSHRYSKPGYYNVILTVSDTVSGCTSTHESLVFIEGTGTLCKARFDYQINQKVVTFLNTSLGNITDYLWSFGDGTYSTDSSPSHEFVSGAFEVCLTIYNSENECMDDYCQTIVVTDTQTVICIADFTYTLNDATVSFNSESGTNSTNFLWDFGDNNYSTEQDPVHTFTKPNFYKVKLTVFDSINNCFNSKTRTVVVKVGSETLCNASYISFVDENEVYFSNTSSGNATEIFWSFGDGTYSTDSSPAHTYIRPNFYEVCLSIYDSVSGCMDEFCDMVVVTSAEAFLCNAEFDYYTQNTHVNFQPSINGIVTNYFWDFGDGFFSEDIAPEHTYIKSGYYPVTLKIFNDTTLCMDAVSKFIIVIDSTYEACKAEFSWHAQNRKVTFANQSLGLYTNLFWNMGDGNYFTDSAFTHTFDRDGYYWVELTMFNELTGCLDSYADWVVALDTNAIVCQALFTYYAEGTNVGFINLSSGSVTDYFWDFGDGTYSYDSITQHTYDAPGFYEVTFTVYNSQNNCLNQYNEVIKVIDNSTELCQAQFSYYPQDNTVTFTSEALGAFKQLFWDFGDGYNSNQPNPIHTYNKPGYYQVMHTVIDTAANCFDSKVKVVFVEGEFQPIGGVVSANFSQYVANDSLTAFLTDLSLGNVTHWYWDFGDNSEASFVQHPEHKYFENDYYRICQTVSNSESQNTLCKFIPVGDVSTKNTAYFTYYADSVTATAYFQNKSLGDIVSYFWDFGDGNTSLQKNPSHSYADTGYYAVCLSTTSSVGRVRTYCTDVRIGNAIDNPCLYSCVWPGDANSDLEANHYDLLTIGLNYGMEGPRREDATIQWYGQFAQNWSTSQIDGTNNKHGDCNGDGIINTLDTMAINQNFAYSHYWQPEVKNADWEIICQWDSEKAEGSRRKAKAILSPPLKKAAGEIYGIGYEIKVLGGDGVYWDSVYVTFDGSWMGTPGEELMTFYNLDSINHIIYVASVRNDHQNVSGTGMVATISMAFKEGFSSSDISFNVTTLGGIEATGLTVQIGGSILLNLGPDLLVCEGESVTLIAPEGFENYTWNTGSNETSIEATTAGKYYLQVTDSLGASATDTIEVVWIPLPEVNLGNDIIAQDSTILNAGDGFATYEWSTGETTQTIKVKTTGSYWVVVTNESGCANSDTIGVTVNITGIHESGILQSVTVYPNPNKGNFWIIYDGNSQGLFRYELLDMQGKEIMNGHWTVEQKFRKMVHPNPLPEGIYQLKCYLNDEVVIKKIVVQ